MLMVEAAAVGPAKLSAILARRLFRSIRMGYGLHMQYALSRQTG